jgi:hypothetical protein
VTLTVLVFTVKVALVRPAPTVTLAGTVATKVWLLESVTVIPPAGAAPFRVTVPVDVLPPVTIAGFRLIDDRDGAVIVRFAFWFPPLYEAEIWTLADPETGTVPIANVALVAPAATVTFAGTEASDRTARTSRAIEGHGAGRSIAPKDRVGTQRNRL